MISGAFASNAYGIPRSTRDADFLTPMTQDDFGRLVLQLGGVFSPAEPISPNAVGASVPRTLHMRASPFRVKLFSLANDPFDGRRFERRLLVAFLDVKLFLQTAEDVLIQKLRWSRQGRRHKDIDDARGVIAVQGDKLDWAYIEKWCDTHGTRTLLDKLRRTTPLIPDEP